MMRLTWPVSHLPVPFFSELLGFRFYFFLIFRFWALR